jgi:thioredoxin 1
MSSFTPKMLFLCGALVVGPPVLVLGLNYNDWFAPKHIDASMAQGEVLFFEANWCGACKAMKPVVTNLKDEGFDIRTMDVDNQQAAAVKYGIHVVPTFVLVRDGEEVRRASGVISPDRLKQLWR